MRRNVQGGRNMCFKNEKWKECMRDERNVRDVAWRNDAEGMNGWWEEG